MSLRIHVERAIGRMKTFAIFKDTLPLSIARLSNQIVCHTIWLESLAIDNGKVSLKIANVVCMYIFIEL